MINLLSDDNKKEIRAGRANVIILNYLLLTLAATGILFVIIAVAYFTLSQMRAGAQQRVDQSILASAAYSDTQQSAKEFRDNLATAKQIIDKEITYSALVLKIAETIPSGVYLESLSLSAETAGTPTVFTARARNVDRALALKSSLENHPELYSDIYFQTVTRGEDEQGVNQAYPVQISISATVRQEALK